MNFYCDNFQDQGIDCGLEKKGNNGTSLSVWMKTTKQTAEKTEEIQFPNDL